MYPRRGRRRAKTRSREAEGRERAFPRVRQESDDEAYGKNVTYPLRGRRRPKTLSREAVTTGKSFPRRRERVERATTKPIVTNAREPRPLKMAVALISIDAFDST